MGVRERYRRWPSPAHDDPDRIIRQRCANAFAPSHDARIETLCKQVAQKKSALLMQISTAQKARILCGGDGDLRTNSQANSSLVRLKKKIHRRGERIGVIG